MPQHISRLDILFTVCEHTVNMPIVNHGLFLSVTALTKLFISLISSCIHEDIQGDKDTCIQIEWEKFFQGTAFTSRLSILSWLCTQHSGVDLKWWIESRCLESRNMYGGNKILIRLAPNSKYSWLKLTRPFTRINTWHRDNETKLQWNWVASEAYDTRKLSLTCIFEPIVLEPASYVLHLVGRFLGVFFKYDLWRH